MWCPQCKRVFDDGIKRCDQCGVRLVEQLVAIRLPSSMVSGPATGTEEPLELEDLSCPVRRLQSGRRRVRARGPEARTEEPFDEAELLEAMAELERVYGITAEEEDPAEPVSPSGYQMLFVFLAIFAALALAAWLLS